MPPNVPGDPEMVVRRNMNNFAVEEYYTERGAWVAVSQLRRRQISRDHLDSCAMRDAAAADGKCIPSSSVKQQKQYIIKT